MATTNTIFRMTAVSMEGGYDIPSEMGYEAATQTYLQGAILIPGSGNVTQETTSPITSDKILGIAEANGQNLASAENGTTTGPTARFTPANPNVIYEANLMTNSAGASAAYTLALTDIYTAYGISQDSVSKYWYINQGDTSNVKVLIVGIKQPDNPVGTINARVLFKFLNSKITQA